MDTLLLPGQNPRAWAETMINLEARKLVNTANTVAAMHLQDGFIRIQFVDEIRAFRGRLRKRKIKHAKPVAAVAMA